MNKMVTDTPKDNVETQLNMVYGKDGWLHIRHGEEGMSIIDFCTMLCMARECLEHPDNMTDETNDALLCECAFDGCPVASIYAALTGFGHVRDRLRMYEDAGMMPPDTEEKSDEIPEDKSKR